MCSLVIVICFLIILTYLSFYSKNDKFGVNVNYSLDSEGEGDGDGDSEEVYNNTCKGLRSGGIHIDMHHVDGVANIFAPEIKIDT